MTSENNRIARYQYGFRSETHHGHARNFAVLYLYDPHDTLLCMAVFDDTDEMCAAPSQQPNGLVTAHFPAGMLAETIDLLRNEKPVYFSWAPAAGSARITSAKEPVGEEELRKLFSFLYV